MTARKKPFTLYTDKEYRQELIRRIKATKRGDRLLLMSMSFEPTEPEIAAIIHELELAASRGVNVSLAVDAHSFLLGPSGSIGPLLGRKQLPKRVAPHFRNKLAIMERINSHPTGEANIINLPTRRLQLPVSGRSHIKAAIINNHIFIGGCNLQVGNRADLMISWESAPDATKLHTTLQEVIRGKHAGRVLAGIDRRFTAADGAAQLFIDSGIRGQSVIMQEALKLIDEAQDWLVITCQYFPNSITARHLSLAAMRGVKVEVVYTHPHHQGRIGGLGQQVSILRERTRVPKSLFAHALDKKDPFLHAKLIASDAGMMIGSHNYVQAGVMLGTAEIALKIPDSELARGAVQTLHRSLGRTTK